MKRAPIKADLSPEYLRRVLSYDRQTGLLIWRSREDKSAAFNARWAGRLAGSLTADGYVQIYISGKTYRAHRVMWAMETGAWPKQEIDHKNRIRHENQWTNLREATIPQNKYNLGKPKSNTSGYKCIIWHKQKRRWRIQIRVNGKRFYFGGFKSAEAAYKTYCQKIIELHGSFASAG